MYVVRPPSSSVRHGQEAELNGDEDVLCPLCALAHLVRVFLSFGSRTLSGFLSLDVFTRSWAMCAHRTMSSGEEVLNFARGVLVSLSECNVSTPFHNKQALAPNV